MNLLGNVSDIMTKDLVTVSPRDDMLKAESIFQKYGFHHIPVTDEGKLVGMLSKSDYRFFKRGFGTKPEDEEAEKLRLKSRLIGEIMVTGLAKLAPDDRINVALEVFKENLFHAIPVVDNDRIVGLVSTLDIIKALALDEEAHTSYK